MAGSNDSATERFWRKVTIVDQCWEWNGGESADGYGKFRVGGAGSNTMRAHVVSHRAFTGSQGGPGIEVHHLCENRCCVRPDHLQEMDAGKHRALHHDRVRTKPSCLNGHDLTKPENVYRWRGVRHCKPCRRNNERIRLGIPYERWKIADG